MGGCVDFGFDIVDWLEKRGIWILSKLVLTVHYFIISLQVVSCTMFLVRCVVITVLANIMGSMRVTVVPVSSNGQFVVIASMCVRQSRKGTVSSIKHIGISVVRVASRNVSMLAWTKMRCNMNGDLAIQRYANKWRCLYRKTHRYDMTCYCHRISRCHTQICHKWAWILVFRGCIRS